MLIHKSEKGMGNEDWYYLRVDDGGKAYVEHEWSHRDGGGYRDGSEKISIHDFLKNGGTRQDKLLQLIASLVN